MTHKNPITLESHLLESMELKENEKLELADTKIKLRKNETVEVKGSTNETKPENLDYNRSEVKNMTESLAKYSRKSKLETKKPHKLKILEEIGYGTFGLVSRVEDVDTGEVSALKVMELEDFHTAELKILKLLKKSNGHAHHCIQLINNFRTENEIYLQFPLYGPTLQSILDDRSFTRFSEDEICEIMKQICIGVKFLHDHHIVHSDLKQDNVIFIYGTTARDFNPNHLIDSSIESGHQLSHDSTDTQHMVLEKKGPKIVLIDFGQAFMDPKGTGIDKAVCCTLFRPPESHLEIPVSYPVDVWSVGLLCFLMYQEGRNLLTFGSPLEMLAQMEQIFGQFPKNLRKVKAAAQYFTSGGFTKRPEDFDQTLLRHVKSFKKYRDSSSSYSYRLFPLMQNLLKLDAKERMTMNEVIKSESW